MKRLFIVGALVALLVGGIALAQSEFQPQVGGPVIAEDGTDLTQRSKLNFIGGAMTCVDNAGLTRTDCTTTAAPWYPDDGVHNTFPYTWTENGVDYLSASNLSYKTRDQANEQIDIDGRSLFLPANKVIGWAKSGADEAHATLVQQRSSVASITGFQRSSSNATPQDAGRFELITRSSTAASDSWDRTYLPIVVENGFVHIGDKAGSVSDNAVNHSWTPRFLLDLGDKAAEPEAEKKLALYSNAYQDWFVGFGVDVSANTGTTGSDIGILSTVFDMYPYVDGNVDWDDRRASYLDTTGLIIGRDTHSAHTRLDLGTSVNARKLGVYNNAAGDAFYGLGVTSGQLEIRTADDGTDDPAIAVSSDGTTSFSRITSADAGARIDFRRASDNEKYWHFDVTGSTATPGFRVFEGVHPNYTTSARFQNGRLGVGPKMNSNPPLHLLDLGDALDSRKLAVFQSIAGNNFFGLGVSSGVLEIRAADDGDDAAEMIVRANGGGVAIDSEGTYIDRAATLTINANKNTAAFGSPSVSVNTYSLIQGNGSDADFRGVSAGFFMAADRPAVGAGTEEAGVLYGVQATVKPLEDRNNVPNDDAVAFLGQNDGTGKATDGFYLGSGSGGITGSQWTTQMTLEAPADYGIRLLGEKVSSHLEIFDGTGVEANLKMRVYKNGELQLGSNSATEGGELQLNRASDDTPHWFIDSTGSAASPWFRIFSKHDDTSVIKHWLTFKTSESYVDFGGNKLVNYTSFSGALLALTTDASVTVAAGNPGTTLDLDTETYDEGDWHTGSNGYFVIPTGVTKIRASFSAVKVTEQAGTLKLRILKNNSINYAGAASRVCDTSSVAGCLVIDGSTAIVSVTAGDTIKLAAEAVTADNSIDQNVATWFQIEAIN